MSKPQINFTFIDEEDGGVIRVEQDSQGAKHSHAIMAVSTLLKQLIGEHTKDHNCPGSELLWLTWDKFVEHIGGAKLETIGYAEKGTIQ